jgi:hypothetical protein
MKRKQEEKALNYKKIKLFITYMFVPYATKSTRTVIKTIDKKLIDESYLLVIESHNCTERYLLIYDGIQQQS